MHVLSDLVGGRYYWASSEEMFPNWLWQKVQSVAQRELGVWDEMGDNDQSFEWAQQIVLDGSIEDVFDVIELVMQMYSNEDWANNESKTLRACRASASVYDATNEINARFLEHGIGYSVVEHRVLRADGHFIYDELVEPTVQLLHEERFSGASEEFLKAHEHCRHGRHRDAISMACSSFESTMKTIHSERGWKSPSPSNASNLIKSLKDNGLIGAPQESYLNTLVSLITSGLPALGNSQARHGQGTAPIVIPEHLANYALNLAAANILFLVRAHQAMPLSNQA